MEELNVEIFVGDLIETIEYDYPAFHLSMDCFWCVITNGDITLLFLLFYCAAQIVLDSTRYDALYFHSNGFVSIVQVACAVTMVSVIVFLSVRMVKKHGLIVWNLLAWGFMLPLLGVAGYMEYYVQRHGDKALLSYTVMSLCLAAVTAITVYIYYREKLPKKRPE